MNPVYPGMLTFAELTWKGGGYAGWTATIGQPKTERAKSFTEFEKKTTRTKKKQYFKDLAFNHVKKSDLNWIF
ncbi:hypothetical protein [Flavobacterium sp. GCM10022190]|uniref:hypothetical protein n=1 Tax=Flavobacterium sp. GCM10022190 TaxID=3252639 RepID=UPI003619EFB8